MKNDYLENERLLKIILAPHVSEKSTFLGEKHNQTIFRVMTDANKHEIKAAVELLWKDQKIEVENFAQKQILLTPDNSVLSEVVVTAYGKAPKRWEAMPTNGWDSFNQFIAQKIKDYQNQISDL